MKRLLLPLVSALAISAVLSAPSHADAIDATAGVYRGGVSTMLTSGSVVRDLQDYVSITTPFRPTGYELVRNAAVVTGTTDASNLSWSEFISFRDGQMWGRWSWTVRVPLTTPYVSGDRIEITASDTVGNRTTIEAQPSAGAGSFARVQFNRNSASLTSTARRWLDRAADTAVRHGAIRLEVTTFRDSREQPELANARAEAIRAHLAARRPALALMLNPVTMAMSDKPLSRDRVAVISAFLL